jgi:L-threonylcarbamoyladenylate synthase
MPGAARGRSRARPPRQEEGGDQESRHQEDGEEEDRKEKDNEEKGRQEESDQEEVMKSLARAVDVLLRGGVIAYPTEGVFGLGCLPDDHQAVQRVVEIKQRDAAKGLILIAANIEQLDGWLDLPVGKTLPEPEPQHPVTWIVPAGPMVTPLLRGEHESIAVRLTTNPTAKALCEAVDSPLVSTSANLSGKPTARNRYVLHRQFAGVVDYVVPGDCGPASGPSEIRDLVSGRVLRPRAP